MDLGTNNWNTRSPENNVGNLINAKQEENKMANKENFVF